MKRLRRRGAISLPVNGAADAVPNPTTYMFRELHALLASNMHPNLIETGLWDLGKHRLQMCYKVLVAPLNFHSSSPTWGNLH